MAEHRSSKERNLMVVADMTLEFQKPSATPLDYERRVVNVFVSRAGHAGHNLKPPMSTRSELYSATARIVQTDGSILQKVPRPPEDPRAHSTRRRLAGGPRHGGVGEQAEESWTSSWGACWEFEEVRRQRWRPWVKSAHFYDGCLCSRGYADLVAGQRRIPGSGGYTGLIGGQACLFWSCSRSSPACLLL